MYENLVIDSLQTSRFQILSDHFQCLYDAINTFQGKVPASLLISSFLVCLSLRVPQAFFGGEGKLHLFSKQYTFFRPSSYFLWSNDFDNQQNFVLNSL